MGSRRARSTSRTTRRDGRSRTRPVRRSTASSAPVLERLWAEPDGSTISTMLQHAEGAFEERVARHPADAEGDPARRHAGAGARSGLDARSGCSSRARLPISRADPCGPGQGCGRGGPALALADRDPDPPVCGRRRARWGWPAGRRQPGPARVVGEPRRGGVGADGRRVRHVPPAQEPRRVRLRSALLLGSPLLARPDADRAPAAVRAAARASPRSRPAARLQRLGVPGSAAPARHLGRMKADVAVVGNGVAGYACAARLARHGIRPLLIGPGLPVDRPPLTKAALADGVPRLLADEAKLAERGIDRLDGRVGRADLERATAAWSSPAGESLERRGRSRRPGHRARVRARRRCRVSRSAFVNADPASQLRTSPTGSSRGPRQVLVVGAGLIGTESAATLATAGHDVTVVDLLRATARPASRSVARAGSRRARAGRRALPRRRAVRARRAGGRRDRRARRARRRRRHRGDGRPARRSSGTARRAGAAASGRRVHARAGLRPRARRRRPGARAARALRADPLSAMGRGDRHRRAGRRRDRRCRGRLRAAAVLVDRHRGVCASRRSVWRRSCRTGRSRAHLHVGRDAAGTVVCAMVVDDPRGFARRGSSSSVHDPPWRP